MSEHELRIGRKRLGAMPLAHINGAAGVRYGTTGECSCRGWRWSTNNLPPSRGGRREAEQAHGRHLATVAAEAGEATTVDSRP